VPTKAGGLTGAFEIMTVNGAIRNLIREGKTHQINMMIQNSPSEGMLTMSTALDRLLQAGIIDKFAWQEAKSEYDIEVT
jgi:twitching motility protein PilT